MNPYESSPFEVVAAQEEETRSAFIRKTYWHLAGAITVFALLEFVLLNAGLEPAVAALLSASKYSWLAVMAAFMAVSWIADRWARSSTSLAVQYAGLGLYILAEAVIFLPLLMVARGMEDNVISKAASLTAVLVIGLSIIAFTTRKDFTFLGGFLKIGGWIALGAIVASFFLPITLGFWFSVIMVLFAAGCVLYDTSAIQHHYRPGQHVAASLSLFASVALMFWYILRLVMSRD